jgi:hypothetical protein
MVRRTAPKVEAAMQMTRRVEGSSRLASSMEARRPTHIPEE